MDAPACLAGHESFQKKRPLITKINTMNNLQSKTLAQLVNANYRTAAIFEKYNLDFCCRGKRTLLQACNESQLPFETIEKELELVQNKLHSQGWQDMSLGQLAD